MSGNRKDNKGRVLRKGETQRSRDGMYVYTYTDPEGMRHSIYSMDIVKLRNREEQLIKDQLDGIDSYVAGSATLNYVFDRYIATKSELRETTRRNYEYMYDRYVRKGFGLRKIGKIQYSDVLQFYQKLIIEKKMQVNTLEIINTVLSPTFQLAVRDDVIRKNPADGVMAQLKKKLGRNTGVRHALTVGQQRSFVEFVSNSIVYTSWASLLKFLLGTGCRIGEAIGITWKDIDFDKRTISINHSLVYYVPKADDKDSKTEFRLHLPKTRAGIRNIPMMNSVYDLLSEELEYQKEQGFSDIEIGGLSGFVFLNRFGNIHNPQAVNRAIKRIREAYNLEEEVKAKKERREPVLLPHFSCHHLRHTFCSRLCENETNLKVIQSIMGHASIETTMDIYAEVNDLKKQESINNLANKLDVF